MKELMMDYQNSIVMKRSNTNENCGTKSFKDHYQRIQLREFREIEGYLRELVRKECLKKISDPYSMLKEYGTANQNTLLGQLCQEFQTSTPLCWWSKTEKYILIDIQTGYLYIYESKEIRFWCKQTTQKKVRIPFGLVQSPDKFQKQCKACPNKENLKSSYNTFSFCLESTRDSFDFSEGEGQGPK